MIIVTDEKRIRIALVHAKDVLDLFQQGRGNSVINTVIRRDIEAVERGDYSGITIKRLDDEKYKK